MTTASLETRVESIKGPLLTGYSQVVPETIQHADEINVARRTDESLRRTWFITADFPFYTIEDGTEWFYLARGKDNLIFRNLEEAIEQLIRTKYYLPKIEEIEDVKKAESTLRVKLSDLELQKNKIFPEYSFFEIDTTNYGSLNQQQRLVAERIFGQGDEFEVNMKMFRDNRIAKIGIHFLSPEYIRQHAETGSAIAIICELGMFVDNSYFSATSSAVRAPFLYIRGSRKNAEN